MQNCLYIKLALKLWMAACLIGKEGAELFACGDELF